MKTEPDVFVLRMDTSVASTREEILARLRHPDGDGLHTRFWRFETLDGEVLAERLGAGITIHEEVCLRALGEAP